MQNGFQLFEGRRITDRNRGGDRARGSKGERGDNERSAESRGQRDGTAGVIRAVVVGCLHERDIVGVDHLNFLGAGVGGCVAVPSSCFELNHVLLETVAESLNVSLSGGSLVVGGAETVAVRFDFDVVSGHSNACARSEFDPSDHSVALFRGVILAKEIYSCVLLGESRHLRCCVQEAAISGLVHIVEHEGQSCIFTCVLEGHEVPAAVVVRALHEAVHDVSLLRGGGRTVRELPGGVVDHVQPGALGVDLHEEFSLDERVVVRTVNQLSSTALPGSSGGDSGEECCGEGVSNHY